MSKVLLVEDDINLREIFEMRLQAEGYETLSAADGEEALMVATKEKPDLIIADVMMPKLSGFEMLETLRAAPEMANAKVIMMTALGQAEDRARGEKLGVVKYLVKSQVTLEDFVRVVREVLPPSDKGPAGTANNQGSKSTNKQESEQSMQDDNTNPTMPPAGGGDSSATPADDQMSAAQEQNVVNDQVSDFAAGAGADQPAPPPDAAPASPPAGDSGTPTGDTPSFPPTSPPTEPTPPGPQPPIEEPKPEEGSPPPAGV